MDQKTMLRHQNYMWGLRQEMGWPLFKPANDCLAFTSGGPMDAVIGMETARIAQIMHKDVIYAGWRSADAVEPVGFTVILREMLLIDVIDRCFPWAEDETSPIILVSTRRDEMFMVGQRGLLMRVPGKPRALGKGRKLAMKRIRGAAAMQGEELAANNMWLPIGGEWAEPDAPAGTIVQFS